MKKERFLPVFRCVITTFSITAQQPVGISTSGQALVKLGPLWNTMVKTGSESVNKRLRYRLPVHDHPHVFAPKTSITGCASYVRPRYVADQLAKVINLTGDLKKLEVKPEAQPEVLGTQVGNAF
jgi:hypothetical protein